MNRILSFLIGCILNLSPGWAALAAVPVVVFEYENETGRQAAEMCAGVWESEGENVVEDLGVSLPGTVIHPDTVMCFMMTDDQFSRTFSGTLPDWGVGVALTDRRVVALNLTRIPAVGRGVREVFLHEMVHAIIGMGARGAWLPTWLHEGSAMVYSGEWKFVDTVTLILDGRVPSLANLQGPYPAGSTSANRAYRTSLLAVEKLRERYGDDVVGRLVAEAARTRDFRVAFENVTTEPVEVFYGDFDATMRLRFGWLVMLTRWPGLFVLLALILTVGAVRKIVLGRRRLAEMEESEAPEPPGEF